MFDYSILNWLFTGKTNEGANKTADIYSLIESCKLRSINPTQYLEDMMRRIQDAKQNDLS